MTVGPELRPTSMARALRDLIDIRSPRARTGRAHAISRHIVDGLELRRRRDFLQHFRDHASDEAMVADKLSGCAICDFPHRVNGNRAC